MTDLFEWTPPPGKTDTSAEAAATIAPKLSKRRKLVLSTLGVARTGSEIAAGLGIPELSVRPRLTELHQHGYIEDTGNRRPNKWGHNEIVWKKKDN